MPMRPALAAAAALLAACASPPPVPPAYVDLEGQAPDAPEPVPEDVGPTPEDTFVGLDELPCARGEQCAPEGPFLGDTCCAFGDNLVALSVATAAEAVDVETDGEHVWACGGFGVRVNDITLPEQPVFLGGAASRCQRIGVGPLLPGGERVFWLAHHGDSWVNTPSLQTWRITESDQIVQVDLIEDPGTRFEGLLYDERGFLYVATHDGGVRVYEVAEDGAPTIRRVLGGFDNAQKLARDGDRLFVTDETGVVVIDVTEPLAATVVGTVTTAGPPRDLAVGAGRLFAAKGARGVDVFDLDGDALPSLVANLASAGSSQAVDVAEGRLAVADWSHVSVYDAATLGRLGSERTRPYPRFEQDLGVAWTGDVLAVAEWEAVHLLRWRDGYVAPDAFVGEELLSFDAAEPSVQQIEVVNRGPLELELTSVGASDPAFVPSVEAAVVPPGGSLAIDVAYVPPAPEVSVQSLRIVSNDPDVNENPRQVPLHAVDTSALDVGDSILTEEFAWLDPTGDNDVANLEGRVLVLAYFALF